jgi:SSS family solute:Na+ symporter
MTACFALLMALSLLLAMLSRRGGRQRAEDFFVASGQFGTLLFFVLSVGETYSVGTVLGFPGGVVAHGTAFISWFLGYILLSFPIGYFLYPWIWRAGRMHGAVTLPDLFGRHFGSRFLELLVTLASIAFLLPLGVMQFIGLNTVFAGAGWPVPAFVPAASGGALAFAYIALSGIRAPAYVSILKDALVMGAILTTGLACLGAPAGGHPGGGSVAPAATSPSELFAISTILLQSIGFCVVPQTCAAVFTARSPGTVRRAQVAMPLYMLMFPFLLAAASFAAGHGLQLKSPNDVLLAAARAVLPGWGVGLVMAGAALSALVVLTGICLALGALITRNLLPRLDGAQQLAWSKGLTALYLLLSIAGAAHSAQLMIAFNNLFYFGVTQSAPGLLAMLLLRRARAAGVAAGLAAGDSVSIALHWSGVPLGGCNPGLIGLAVNVCLLLAITWAWPGRDLLAIAARGVPPGRVQPAPG